MPHDMIDAPIMGNATGEGFEFPCFLQRRERSKQGEHDVLHQVLAQVTVAFIAGRDARERRPHIRDRLFERHHELSHSVSRTRIFLQQGGKNNFVSSTQTEMTTATGSLRGNRPMRNSIGKTAMAISVAAGISAVAEVEEPNHHLMEGTVM